MSKYKKKFAGLCLSPADVKEWAGICRESAEVGGKAFGALCKWFQNGAKVDGIEHALEEIEIPFAKIALSRMFEDIAARWANYCATNSAKSEAARVRWNRANKDNTLPAIATNDESEHPTEAEIMAAAKAAGVPAEYARTFAKDMEARGWGYMSRGAFVALTRQNLRAVLVAFHKHENKGRDTLGVKIDDDNYEIRL